MAFFTVLFVYAVVVALWVALAALLYRVVVSSLRLVTALPGIGRLLSVTSKDATDTFKLSIGGLFGWTVSVNRERGTVTGSIQIDSAKRWKRLGPVVACLAAIAVPMVAGVMMPAALVIVGLGLAQRGAQPAL